MENGRAEKQNKTERPTRTGPTPATATCLRVPQGQSSTAAAEIPFEFLALLTLSLSLSLTRSFCLSLVGLLRDLFIHAFRVRFFVLPHANFFAFRFL